MRGGERLLAHHTRKLQPFFNDPAVTEVVVNEPGMVGVEAAGVWTWHPMPEMTFKRLEAVAIAAAFLSGQDVSSQQPACGCTLPGGYRMQIALPPLVPAGRISLTIRKRAKDFTPTLKWLEERQYFRFLDPSVNWPHQFRSWVQKKRTILIAGEIGSSKTTLAEALCGEIPLHERIGTVEDAAELADLPHVNQVNLFYSKGGQGVAQITAEDCIEMLLRMRIDRPIIQELRDAAAWAFLRINMAGHPGGMTTIHAESPRRAMDAAVGMMLQHKAGAALGPEGIRELLHRYVHVVVHCAKDRSEKPGPNPYYVTSVWEVPQEAPQAVYAEAAE